MTSYLAFFVQILTCCIHTVNHFAVWCTLAGAAARMADSTTLLSICDPVHLVVTKTTRSGDTSLISSHFLDWRQVLAAAESRCTISVELMGIGQCCLMSNVMLRFICHKVDMLT